MMQVKEPKLIPVKRMRDAQFAYCAECDSWLGCQYWSLSKSVGVHLSGMGHKAQLLAYQS